MPFNKNQYIRIISDIALCACIVFGPWWLMVIGLIVATVYFENYFEIILFGVLIDALYGTGASSIFHVPIAYTVFAITMFLLSIPLRKRIRATI